jgi:hypothetical protein
MVTQLRIRIFGQVNIFNLVNLGQHGYPETSVFRDRLETCLDTRQKICASVGQKGILAYFTMNCGMGLCAPLQYPRSLCLWESERTFLSIAIGI